MCILKYSLVFLLIFGIASCSTETTIENTEASANESSLKGKFIRVKDNNRAGIEGILDLISEIEFRNEHCHFTYVGTKMSGKYTVDEGFVYIYTGSDLGTLSMEIINEDHLEGEGYIHGTFKKNGTFVPEEKAKNNNANYQANKNKVLIDPFESREKDDIESNEESEEKEPFKTTSNQDQNPFGSGGNSSGGGFGNDDGGYSKGTGPGIGSGETRIRLNNPSVDHIESDVDVLINLKVTINEEGSIVSAFSTSKTTTTDQRIINQVISAVKEQVKYSKSPGAVMVTQYLSIKINAR